MPEVYARDCDDCRIMWYDDDGEPVTRNGKHLPRPAPPACHRCKKHRMGIEPLSRQNQELYEMHTDAELRLLDVVRLSLGQRLALRTIERTVARASRMRLALDLREALHGHA